MIYIMHFWLLVPQIIQGKTRKRVNKTRIKEGKSKEEQRPYHHSDIWRHGGNEFQYMSPSCSHHSSPQREWDVAIARKGRARGREVIPEAMFFMFRARHGEIFLPGEIRRFEITGEWRCRNPHREQILLGMKAKLCRSIKAHSLIS